MESGCKEDLSSELKLRNTCWVPDTRGCAEKINFLRSLDASKRMENYIKNFSSKFVKSGSLYIWKHKDLRFLQEDSSGRRLARAKKETKENKSQKYEEIWERPKSWENTKWKGKVLSKVKMKGVLSSLVSLHLPSHRLECIRWYSFCLKIRLRKKQSHCFRHRRKFENVMEDKYVTKCMDKVEIESTQQELMPILGSDQNSFCCLKSKWKVCYWLIGRSSWKWCECFRNCYTHSKGIMSQQKAITKCYRNVSILCTNYSYFKKISFMFLKSS